VVSVSDAIASQQYRQRPYVFRLLLSSIRPSIHSFFSPSDQILLPRYLMNGLNNCDKTDREYSLAPTDDLIRFCGSVVKVTS